MVNYIYRLFQRSSVMSKFIICLICFILFMSIFYFVIYLLPKDLLTTFFFILCIFLCLNILLTVFAINVLWNPLIQLQKELSKVEKGDYTARLDIDLYKKSPKVIQHVGNTFNETVDKIQQKEAALTKLSNTDPLTNIANRRFFDLEYKRKWYQSIRMQERLTVVLIDIDHFKKFNDAYGHQIGDQCLVMVTESLAKIINHPEYFIARYGGEEFIMVLRGASQQEVTTIAEQARQSVESLQIPLTINGNETFITVSIGVASVIPAENNKKESLLKLADEALYEAKNSGRNNIVEKSMRHLTVV